MAARNRSFWILLIFILSGLVIGGLLGDLAANTGVDDKGVDNTLNNICRCNEKNAE